MLAVEWVPVAVAAVAVAAVAVAAAVAAVAVAAVAVVSWQRDQSPMIPRGGGGDGDDCCCCCGHHSHCRCHCWCHSFQILTPSYKITTTYCMYSTMTGWLTVSVGTVLARCLHVYFVHPQQAHTTAQQQQMIVVTEKPSQQDTEFLFVRT